MTRRLERRYGFGHHHFVTFSCYRRLPYLAEPAARKVFESSLETMRRKYGLQIDSYVVMPEHIHLLISEPNVRDPSDVMKVLKQRVSRALRRRKKKGHGRAAGVLERLRTQTLCPFLATAVLRLQRLERAEAK